MTAVLVRYCLGVVRLMFSAIKEGNIEAVKQAIASGADVNAKAKGGSTPLHAATDKGHKEIA